MAAPGSAAIGSAGIHLCALYALAFLHSHDDQAARQAVAYALSTVRRDLAAGASVGELARSGGLWRALADHLHTGYAPGPVAEKDMQVDARRLWGARRCEAIALYAAGCTDSHAAGLLDVARPEVRRLRRAW